MSTVTLIDYGAGNLRSLRAAFERVGAAVDVAAEAAEVDAAERLVLPGRVVAIDWAARVPHMGWNDVAGDQGSAVCYFAHSFAVDCEPGLVAGRTPIDDRQVPTVVRSGRLSGVQFHPEKSAADGRRMLEAWLAA